MSAALSHPASANKPPATRKARPGWAYRADVAARVLLAIVGAYSVAALWDGALAIALPMAPAEATVTATLLSFAIEAAAALGVFCTRSAARAALALALAALPPAAALLLHFRLGLSA